MSHSDSNSYNSMQLPNCTEIPNVLIDYWMSHLDPGSFRLIIFIFRHTWGKIRAEFQMNTTEISQHIHLSPTLIIKALEKFQSLKMIRFNSSKDSTYEIVTVEVLC